MTVHVWIGQISSEGVAEGPPPQNLEPKPELLGCFPIPNVWAATAQRHQLKILIVDDPRRFDNWSIDLPVEPWRYFVRIWPPYEGVIDWPPPVVIDRPANEAMAPVFRIIEPWPIDQQGEDAP